MNRATILYFIIFMVLVFAGKNAHADSWSTTDKTMAATFSTLMLVDALQTHEIANTPGHEESNPILGKHPSDTRIAIYFIGMTAITLTAAHKIPKLRRFILTTGNVLQIYSVRHNYMAGIKIDF